MNKTVYVDYHVIQSVPPSCLNRDDTGSPKTAVYGGARRARVSSQSWKRAMRLMFRDNYDVSELGIRTLLVYGLVADEIIKLKPEMVREDAVKMAKEAFAIAGIEGKSDSSEKIKALYFMGTQQAKNLALLAVNGFSGQDEKREVIAALNENNPVDIALFGRMVAKNALLNCDACAQVAHAISTHRIENDYDYYTAVDDLSPDESTGAGMIGTLEYNSSTLYRYATIAAHNLYKELIGQDDAFIKAVKEFTRAFICSIPNGKQNSYAAHTVPDAVLVAIRTDRPLNLVGAFETPIRAEGFVAASAKAFADYATDVYNDFCHKPAKAYIIGNYLENLGDRVTLDTLLDEIGGNVSGMVAT